MEKAVYGGSCLGTIPDTEGEHAGKKLFVPFTLPDELIRASVLRDESGYSTGQLTEVLEESMGRTTPACPYFGRCGGCQYQHATDAQQIALKVAILRETLTRAGITPIPSIVPVHGPAYGYRNRIRLHIAKANGLQLGYYEAESNVLLPVDQCPIAAPLLQRAVRAVQEFPGGTVPNELVQMEFFTNPAEAALMVSVFVQARAAGEQGSSSDASLHSFYAGLQRACPELQGLSVYRLPERARNGRRDSQLAPALLTKIGEQSLRYRALDAEYRVSAGSFFQVNRFLIDPLVEIVVRHAGDRLTPPKLAWDLYAGVGLFALPLTALFSQVYAVEVAPSSFADLRENLASTRAKCVAATTLEFLRNEARRRPYRHPDLVIADPPRAGLGREVTALLAEIGAPRLIYISCDPTTLARDLRPLIQSGYTARHMYLVDLFPQTFHLETVTLLERR